jgi:hypothetical protein
VERSGLDPGGAWRFLAVVPGRVGVVEYAFRDEEIQRTDGVQYRVTLVRDGIDIASRLLQVEGVTYRFHLARNTPNPFNPRTRISFELGETQRASLVVFDVRGRRVRTLLSKRLEAGPHWRDWDGTDDGGRRVASGVYLVRLSTRTACATQRMLLLQ